MVPGSITAERSRSANDATDGVMVPPSRRANGACYTGRSRQPSTGWLSVRGVRVLPTRGRPALLLKDDTCRKRLIINAESAYAIGITCLTSVVTSVTTDELRRFCPLRHNRTFQGARANKGLEQDCLQPADFSRGVHDPRQTR